MILHRQNLTIKTLIKMQKITAYRAKQTDYQLLLDIDTRKSACFN